MLNTGHHAIFSYEKITADKIFLGQVIKWPSILHNIVLNINIDFNRCESLNQFFSRRWENTKIYLHLWYNLVSELSQKMPSVFFPLLVQQ